MLRGRPFPGSWRERQNRGPQRSGRCRRRKTAQNQGHNRKSKGQKQHIHDFSPYHRRQTCREKRAACGSSRVTPTASQQPHAARSSRRVTDGSFLARSGPRLHLSQTTGRAAQPAGFMVGHRPTRGRNQPAEHAHHQATQPAPFDATARAKPGFRPPASPEPPQPGRRADERGEPLSCSPPSGHRIDALASSRTWSWACPCRPRNTAIISRNAATGDASAGALHGSFLARCRRPRTTMRPAYSADGVPGKDVPARSRSKEGDHPALRQRGNRPCGMHCRDRLNGCPFLFSFGSSRPPSYLGRPLARLSRIINVIRNAPGQSGPDRGYSRAQPRCCVVYLHAAWPGAALRFPYYSTLYGIKKGSRPLRYSDCALHACLAAALRKRLAAQSLFHPHRKRQAGTRGRDDRGLKRRHDDGMQPSLAAGRFCRQTGHSVPQVDTGASACRSAGKHPARMTKRRVLDTDLQPA